MEKVDHRGAGTHAKNECCCLNGEAQDINRRVRDGSNVLGKRLYVQGEDPDIASVPCRAYQW